MDILRCIHLIVNTIFVIYLSVAWGINTGLFSKLVRLFKIDLDRTFIFILIPHAIFHIILMAVLTMIGSIKLAILVSTFLFLHWSYWLYFNEQRFVSIIKRTAIVRKHPLHYPAFILGAVSSSICATLYNINWFWIFALIPTWFIYGFLCAEIAIHKRMKKMNCDRKMAKFAINTDLGRDHPIFNNPYKFPFP